MSALFEPYLLIAQNDNKIDLVALEALEPLPPDQLIQRTGSAAEMRSIRGANGGPESREDCSEEELLLPGIRRGEAKPPAKACAVWCVLQ